MDSAKKSVEKILEIARKHGYRCIVAFKKGDNQHAGATGVVTADQVAELNKIFANIWREESGE